MTPDLLLTLGLDPKLINVEKLNQELAKTKLGQITRQFDTLKKSIIGVNAQLTKTAHQLRTVAQSSFIKAAQGIKTVTSHTERFKDAQGKVHTATTKVTEGLNQNRQAMQRHGTNMKEAILNATKWAAIYFVIYRAFRAFTGAIRMGISTGVEYSKGLIKTIRLVAMESGNIEELKRQYWDLNIALRQFAAWNAITVTDLQEIAYHIKSAGRSLEDVKKQFADLAKFKVTFFEVKPEDLVKTVMGLVNIFGQGKGSLAGFATEAEKVNRVLDQMATLISKHLVEAPDITQSMQYMAAAVKVFGGSLEFALATLGVMRDNLMKAGMAGRSLRRDLAVMMKGFEDLAKRKVTIGPEQLLSYLEQVRNELQKSKVDVTEAFQTQVKASGDMGKALEELGSKIQKTTNVGGKLFQTFGLRGAPLLILMAHSVDDLRKTMEDLYKSEGNLDKAFMAVNESLYGQSIIFQTLKKEMATALIPMLAVEKSSKGMNDLMRDLVDLFARWGAAAMIVVGGLIYIIDTLDRLANASERVTKTKLDEFLARAASSSVIASLAFGLKGLWGTIKELSSPEAVKDFEESNKKFIQTFDTALQHWRDTLKITTKEFKDVFKDIWEGTKPPELEGRKDIGVITEEYNKLQEIIADIRQDTQKVRDNIRTESQIAKILRIDQSIILEIEKEKLEAHIKDLEVLRKATDVVEKEKAYTAVIAQLRTVLLQLNNDIRVAYVQEGEELRKHQETLKRMIGYEAQFQHMRLARQGWGEEIRIIEQEINWLYQERARLIKEGYWTTQDQYRFEIETQKKILDMYMARAREIRRMADLMADEIMDFVMDIATGRVKGKDIFERLTEGIEKAFERGFRMVLDQRLADWFYKLLGGKEISEKIAEAHIIGGDYIAKAIIAAHAQGAKMIATQGQAKIAGSYIDPRILAELTKVAATKGGINIGGTEISLATKAATKGLEKLGVEASTASKALGYVGIATAALYAGKMGADIASSVYASIAARSVSSPYITDVSGKLAKRKAWTPSSMMPWTSGWRLWPSVEMGGTLGMAGGYPWVAGTKDIGGAGNVIMDYFNEATTGIIQSYQSLISQFPMMLAQSLRTNLSQITFYAAAGRKDMDVLGEKYAAKMIYETYNQWGMSVADALEEFYNLPFDIQEMFGIEAMTVGPGGTFAGGRFGTLRYNWPFDADLLRQQIVQAEGMMQYFFVAIQAAAQMVEVIEVMGKSLDEYSGAIMSNVKNIMRYYSQVMATAQTSDQIREIGQALSQEVSNYISAASSFIIGLQDIITQYEQPERVAYINLERWYKEQLRIARGLGVGMDLVKRAYTLQYEDLIRQEQERARQAAEALRIEQERLEAERQRQIDSLRSFVTSLKDIVMKRTLDDYAYQLWALDVWYNEQTRTLNEFRVAGLGVAEATNLLTEAYRLQKEEIEGTIHALGISAKLTPTGFLETQATKGFFGLGPFKETMERIWKNYENIFKVLPEEILRGLTPISFAVTAADLENLSKQFAADLIYQTFSKWGNELERLAQQGILGGTEGLLASLLGGTPLQKGIEYVPYTPYPAILHKGERVETAEQARESRHPLTIILDVKAIDTSDFDRYVKHKLIPIIREASEGGVRIVHSKGVYTV